MPSLVDCLIAELASPDLDEPVNPTDLMAELDLDIDAISSVEGSWETLDIGEREAPEHEEIFAFNNDGPSVYMDGPFVIVRGHEGMHQVFFAFAPTV